MNATINAPTTTVGLISREFILDEDHKEIDQMLSALRESIVKGRGLRAIFNAADALIAKTEEHFRQEESVLSAIGYAGLDEHVTSHAELTRDLHQIKRGLMERQISAALRLSQVFGEWIERHAELEDSRYELAIREFMYKGRPR
jgi:hemerythrin-like metal-binding protein